jgi:hypothetical protein
MPPNVIDTAVFSLDLQTEFANLSGDWNPMHMSSVAARRTLAGRPVVHGIHTILSALEGVATSSPGLPVPSSLAVNFWKPMYLDEPVEFHRTSEKNADLRIRAVVDGITAVELHIALGEDFLHPERFPSSDPEKQFVCRELTLEEMTGLAGKVQLAATEEKITARFPNAARWLGPNRVGGLLSLSRLVGMECPGLHSLFSGFLVEFTATGTHSSYLEYQVVSTDKRFRLVKINVNGLGLRGTVDAFARHPPSVQMSIQELSSVVSPSEFEGQRVLVVGGSRGLGEFTAKALAAGGGTPIITYATGREDAERVVEEINRWGGHGESLKYDVHLSPLRQIEALAPPISYLYYYPTCQIFRRRSKSFDSALMGEFLKFYVTGFYDLCVALKGLSGQGISAFYPSSVAVEQRPRDMTEYAMAKAAGEVLCSDLSRFWPGMQITQVRLPRLLTDQTATVIPAGSANPLDVILPIIRKVQAVPF